MDSLLPFLQGLAPLQHVGLSRRTASDRRLFPLPNFRMVIAKAHGGILGLIRRGGRDLGHPRWKRAAAEVLVNWM